MEVPVFPERLMFRIHDPGAELEGPTSPSQPVDSLISTSRDQLIVACAQEHLGVQLTVEEWDDAPPPFSDGYEDEAKCVLYLRGALSVDTGSAGRAVEALRLSDAFRARVIDATTESFVFEITGGSAKIDQFINLMLPLGLVEVSRTGIVAIARGPEGM